jgi:Flp pilus assembly protein TadD
MTSLARDRLLYLCLLLVTVTTAVYWPVRHFDFVNFDDEILVYRNKYLKPVTPQHLLHFWKQPHELLYMPLTYTVWAGLAQVADVPTESQAISKLAPHLDPGIFHSFNLLLHVINVLLVFALLRLLCRNDYASAAGALFFGLHPIQVESVAWVAELKGLLAGTCGLLALWSYTLFALNSQLRKAQEGTTFDLGDRDVAGKTPNRVLIFYIFALLAFLGALLSKPSAICFLFLAGLLDTFLLRRSLRAVFSSLVPWLALAMLFAFQAHRSQPVSDLFAPIWARPLIALDALAFYTGKVLWPFALRPEYNRSPETVLHNGCVYWTWVFPVALGTFLWWRRRRWSFLIIGVVFSVAALSPVLGLAQFNFQYYSTVADRYMYMAMLGPALVVASILARRPFRRELLLCVFLLLFLATLTARQVQHWKDSMTLYDYTLSIAPESYVSVSNKGLLLWQEGEGARAKALFEKAIRIKPNFSEAHSNLGSILFKLGDTEGAFSQLIKAVELAPKNEQAYIDLGLAYKKTKKYHYAALAFRRAAELEPDNMLVHLNLAEVYLLQRRIPAGEKELKKARRLATDAASFHLTAAVMLNRINLPAAAVVHYLEALRLQPTDPQLHNDLGVSLLRSGRIPSAINAFHNAIKLNPDYAEAYCNLGLALRQLGREAEAREQFRQALHLKPGFAPAQKALQAPMPFKPRASL